MRWTPLWKVSGSGLIKQLTNPDFKGKTPLNRHPPDEFLRSARMAWTVAFSKSVLVGTATSAGVEAEEIAETKLHLMGVSIALASFLFIRLMGVFGFDCVPNVYPCRNVVIQ